MIGSYVATPPGNKKSISNVAINGDCPTIKLMNKKPTTEWNGYEQSRGDVTDNLLNESRIDITQQHNEDRRWLPPATLLSEVLFVPSIAEY